MYGRIGNHPSLDTFKLNNGFTKFEIKRYYLPLSNKGKIAIKLGLHRSLKDNLPQYLTDKAIPVTNWVSRIKIKTKLMLKRAKVKV